MWWRTFFLQASWSPNFKQNLGFASLYHDAAPPGEVAPDWHFEPFNTNPVTSSFVLPFLAGQEAAGASVEDLRRARAALSTSFAATGDRFAWFLLRPLAGLAGLTAAWLFGQPWAGPLALLLIYNGPQWALRSWLWGAGKRGESPAAEVRRISRMSEAARAAGLLVTGFLAASLAGRGAAWGGANLALGLASLIACYFVLRLRPRWATWIALLLLGLGMTLNHGLR